MGKMTKKQELIDIATKELNGQFVNNIDRKYKEILAKADDALIKLNGKNGGNGILDAMNQTGIPTIDIKLLNLSENIYTAYGNSYDVSTLIQFAKEKGYKIFDMPLVGIYIDCVPFQMDNFAKFLYHIQRVQNTNLDYPILIDDHGYICDGWHRVAKAFLEGRSTIKAIRLAEMPCASGKADTE